MHSFLDAKRMAKTLRQHLGARSIEVSHGECLELVARQFGAANWNVLAAQIEAVTEGDGTLAMPHGWSATGLTDLLAYRLGLDRSLPGTALIESRLARGDDPAAKEARFACLMQSVVADGWRARRVRLTASLRTEDADAGTIWMRVDARPGAVLRFDNMLKRHEHGALRGTTGWTERSIVLDVPPEAASIHYGFLLQNHGRVWARLFRLESVGEDVSPTAGLHSYLASPTNLDFAHSSRSPA